MHIAAATSKTSARNLKRMSDRSDKAEQGSYPLATKRHECACRWAGNSGGAADWRSSSGREAELTALERTDTETETTRTNDAAMLSTTCLGLVDNNMMEGRTSRTEE